MMVVLLVAGIGLLLAGLAAIGFGIPINEFGFGNTLILAGTVAACTGMLLLGLWTAVKELKNIARRLGPDMPAELRETALEAAAPGAAAEAGMAEPAAQPASPPPWQEEAASRDRAANDVPAGPEPAGAAPEAKRRRNLLFSSSSRKERERAQARATEPSAADLEPAPAAARASEPGEAPPATFDDAWPKPERARASDAPPPRRSGRTPSTFAEAGTEPDRNPPTAQNADLPPVTVLKSGVVDGMAYSLYSDGSIEAQMPEGMMRFASIDELRSHLDHRS